MLFNSPDYVLLLILAVAGFWFFARFDLRLNPTVAQGVLVLACALFFVRSPERLTDPVTLTGAAATVVLGSWLLGRPSQVRMLFVFGVSCAFYMAWHPAYIFLILGSAFLDFHVGHQIYKSSSAQRKRAWLMLSLLGNLGLLGTFKYFNFAGQATADTLSLFGVAFEAPFLDVLLPVGISFYTFQTLSYTIDIYRGRIIPTDDPLKFAVFVTYFPQLVAGPIVRASEFLPQLETPPAVRREEISRGLFLIATGMVKKVAIADYLSVNLVDRIFDNPELYTATEVVLALYGFTVQIYCDFSGYTDVARGSGKLMGLKLPENFDRPYQAASPAEFWRRWHMTLSTWLRDYLYYPLGGSRVGPARAYWNLFLTMFLIGIWHGASWTFVVYALLQAVAMVVHRFFYRRTFFGTSKTNRTTADPWLIHAGKVFACMQFVVFSRILFRATSIDNAMDVTSRLFSGTTSVAQVSMTVFLVLVLSFAAHYTPKSWFSSLEQRFIGTPALGQGALLAVVAGFLALVATTEVVPYIYFQF
ncbi:MAG: MBOAT family protein [Deltaproteobacteria bacterium]|nr:MBOAT family protein [Deltaproteobacteria bacterium]